MSTIKSFGKLILIGMIVSFSSCHSGENSKPINKQTDTTNTSTETSGNILSYVTPNLDGPSVLIFNFHSTNRCVSCNAIEANTKKTIETYFANEMKEGRIKMMVYNVDDEANKKISETFQASGTSLFLVKVTDGKDSIMDVTGDGFKYAKHNPDKLIEVLKEKIETCLK